MNRSRRRGALAALVGLALVAAACGGDDSDAAGAETATEGTIDKGMADGVKGVIGRRHDHDAPPAQNRRPPPPLRS